MNLPCEMITQSILELRELVAITQCGRVDDFNTSLNKRLLNSSNVHRTKLQQILPYST